MTTDVGYDDQGRPVYIEVIPHVIHGVECHEAWRKFADCPHEQTEETPPRAAFVQETPPRGPYEGCDTYEKHGACVCSTGYPATCTATFDSIEDDRREFERRMP